MRILNFAASIASRPCFIVAGLCYLCVIAFAHRAAGELPVDYQPPIAIINARIVSAPGNSIERGILLIDKGVIREVGAELTVPEDALVIDAAGLHIYPGFIDAGTHAGITRTEPDDEARARLEDERPDAREVPNASTLEADRRLVHPHWKAEELFDPKAARREDFRREGFTAALVSPAAAIFAGSSAVIQLGEAPRRRSILKADFAQHASLTTGRRSRREAGPPTEMPQYPTTIIGAMAAFRQVMHDAQWHAEWMEWSQRHPRDEHPPLDPDLVTLWQWRQGHRRIVWIANSENEIHRALDLAAEFKLKPIITGAREAWKLTDRLKQQQIPIILSLNWSKEPEKPKGSGADGRGGERPSATETPSTKTAMDLVFDDAWERQPFEPQRQFDERVRLWQEEVDNALRLHEAGIPFAIGSFEMKSIDEVMKNLRVAIKRGLPEEAALAALTRNAAELFGMTSRLGVIESGRLANLTVLDKPFGDEKARVKWVFVEGHRFDVGMAARRPDRRDRKPDGKDKPEESESPGESSVTSKREAGGDVTTAPSTQPTTTAASPTSAPTTPPPEFAVEIEADRKPPRKTGGNVLLRNATLLTITRGVLEETDLIIENGRISAIGRGLPLLPGITAIDLRGYFVMPGIIDCHSHICIDGGLNEFSHSVTPEVRIGDAVNHMSVSAYRALAGGVTCIHTMHGSANTIGGQNVVLRLKYGRPAAEWTFAPAPRTVKFALGENVKQSNFPRRGSRFPYSRMGVEATIRRAFDAAIGYQREHEQYRKEKAAGKDPRPVRRDLRLEALAEILTGDIWIHSHCYRADEILRLLDVAEEYHVRVAVLQHILEGYRIIPEMRRHGTTASTFSDWWAYKIEAYDAIPHNAARMEQGGVVSTVNSDSPAVMRHLNLEAAKSMRYGGLSPDECLRLVTINGAIQLGIDAHVGSLEPGKLGDIAVFDGHPLDTFARCVLTLVDGEIHFVEPGFRIEQPLPARPGRTFPEPHEPLALALAPNESGEYWIVGGTVHPASAPSIEHGIVVISDGKITNVGPAGNTAPTAGATVIDATGLHVYPGLINAASTLGLTEIGSVAGTVDTSDIGDYQPDLLAVSAYNPFASAIEVARCDGITTAMLVPGGGMLSGRTGLIRLDGWSMPEALVASPLGLVVRLPSLPERFPDDMEETRKQEQVDSHRKRLAGLEEFIRRARSYARNEAVASSPEFDRRLEAMRPVLSGTAPVFFAADTYKQILEALEFSRRHQLRPVILGGRQAWKLASKLADQKVDVILGRTSDYPGDAFEPYDCVYRNPAMLARAGVRFAISVPDASLAKLLGIEAGMAVAYGLDEDHALRAITLDAARIIGVADRLGSLEVGKIADVIVCTDTPLQAASRVVAAFIDGRPVELTSKHTRMDNKWRARPSPRLLPDPADLRGPPPLRPHQSN